jgi:hypothetical protein
MADADSIAAPAAVAPDPAPSSPPDTAIAVDALRRALRLLGAASPDWQHRGPTDGSAPLHWPSAIAVAKAHVKFAIRQLRGA